MTSTLTVVIPTRNRSDLAPNAIRSVLDQGDANVRVIVSDNSDESEAERLSEICRNLEDDRLSYVRPPQPLPMAQHWEWAIQQALADESTTHVTYLTDRLVFKPEAVSTLQRLIARYPDSVISYPNDVVLDYSSPVRLAQTSWTGKLFQLKTADMLEECSRVSGWIFFSCLPRMLNCVVPRDVCSQIAARSGNVFLSISPDLCFAYRCLERLGSILYYDKALFVGYAHSRSTGTLYIRGLVNKDADFKAELKDNQWNYLAPIPEFKTGTNTVIHEYCFVKAESQNSKFPEVDMKSYLDAIASEIIILEDPQLKREMELLLERHRSQLSDEEKSVSTDLNGSAQHVSRFSPRRLTSSEGRRALWGSLRYRLGLEMPTPEAPISNGHLPEFETAEAALSYNALHPLPKNLGSALVEDRMPAQQLPQDW